MISIYMNGENKTKQISDWSLYYDNKDQELKLTCHFPSGKKYTQPLTQCQVNPFEQIKGNLLIVKNKPKIDWIEKAESYGRKYTVVYYPNNSRPYVMLSENIQIVSETNLKNEDIFQYFTQVAQARIEHAYEHNKGIAENVLRQLDKITLHPDTVLHAYCSVTNQKRQPPQYLIYPFGINESQLTAVKQAFASQISIIEGPPGTGKTQTILNIVANILINNRTVAILSNNNSAVENVYEKLAKYQLDYLVAKLGSNYKRKNFFDGELEVSHQKQEYTISLQRINNLTNTLIEHLQAKNQIAFLQAQIDELAIEKSCFQNWQSENLTATNPELSGKYQLPKDKITDLLAYLDYLDQRHISFKDRIQLLLYFKIIRTKFINDWQKRKTLFYSLQLAYYEQQLNEKKSLLKKYQQRLVANNFEFLLADLTNCSMQYLKAHLSQTIDLKATFTDKDYQQRFSEFTKRFPIIGSSTHSIINSLGQGALIDYLIIDEASQQDIIPGILGLGCAKNVIIVGDRKQLPHVPIKLDITPPHKYYDCEKYSLLDSFIGLFQDKVPITLLKEHYRCHPKIIQFCNKQFYNEQLIPMTKDNGEQALTLIVTAPGNHTRNLTNLRELDSLNKIGWQDFTEENTGFIAPYNNQIDLSQEHLPLDIVKATTHKFQGRECDNIIFSTVLDKKTNSQEKLDFVDNPHLINVAVSRAKNKFILVTGNDVFTKNNQSIAALIRYIKYYADNDHIYQSPVISAFDLLYEDYDKSLEALNSRLRKNDSEYKSEQIIDQLLREILEESTFQTINYHQQVHLEQLVSKTNNNFTERELEYMDNKASCDFVLYFKIGKNPIAVIEVDGGHHNKPEQKKRDQLKNTILAKAGVPLLRIKTIESQIEEKIKQFLSQSIIVKDSNLRSNETE
ncbi:Superfamily I DNA and RNA helicase or helicase subunit [Gilliamella apicola SCGC AB-598-B02]|nr:Superfamily I DNA and RNA helicase or helicase subunit [Gilliamella apicola SCGC AB-598-B02]